MSGIISSNSSRHTGLLKASSGGSAVHNLIQTQTASTSSTIDFTTGIDSTYEKYVFKFYNIHASANAYLHVNFRDGSSAYDATKTTTMFYASQKEEGSEHDFVQGGGNSQGQVTGIQRLTSGEFHTENDACLVGYLCLFAPSDTTFVKHFIAQTQYMTNSPSSENSYIAGYLNTTAAIDGVQFSMSSGNIDSGSISLYGIS